MEAPLRPDQAFLRLNLRADILHLQADLEWTRIAHETVSAMLMDENAKEPPSGRRATALTETRSDDNSAREDFFNRMAERQRDASATQSRVNPVTPEFTRTETAESHRRQRKA
ncbi:MAG: hypothetical protein ACYDA6_11910 [Solirubrobacteraceae bacterium]